MTHFTQKPTLIIILSLLLILILTAAITTAQEKIKVAGNVTMATTKYETVSLSDADNHTYSFYTYDGVNMSKGQSIFMDGAQVINTGVSDLVKGNGPHQGYVKFLKGGDSILAKWSGIVTTTLSPEGAPLISFAGTFSYIAGAGKYENIQGGGSYSGKYISKMIVNFNWEAEYFIAAKGK